MGEISYTHCEQSTPYSKDGTNHRCFTGDVLLFDFSQCGGFGPWGAQNPRCALYRSLSGDLLRNLPVNEELAPYLHPLLCSNTVGKKIPMTEDIMR